MSIAETVPTSWAFVNDNVSAATEEDLRTFPIHVARERLVQLGEFIRSERILTDLLAWLCEIIPWWTALSREEQDRFLGFSSARLRVITHHARVLRTQLEAVSSAPAPELVSHAEKAYETAQHHRALLLRVLEQSASIDPTLQTQLHNADRPADDGEESALMLRSLVQLAREALKPSSPTARALHEDGLSESFLSQCIARAEAAEATHRATRGNATSSSVTQGDIDAQDGICIVLMDGLRRVFLAARSRDTQVPLLTPRATSYLFSKVLSRGRVA